MKRIITIFFILLAMLILFGCTQGPSATNTFSKLDGSFCTQDGKIIVRMFSTNVCPHCQWVKPAFDEVAKKYADENKIVAYHWEWIYNNDGTTSGDNTLTPELEGAVPLSEEKVFTQFSPTTAVPAFVIGCKYYRVGTQFEKQNDLNAEKEEFVRMIEQAIEESKQAQK